MAASLTITQYEETLLSRAVIPIGLKNDRLEVGNRLAMSAIRPLKIRQWKGQQLKRSVSIPAIDCACFALSPRAMKTTFRWLTSALSFSKKNTLSAP